MNLRLRGWIATLATLLCFGQLLLAANLQYKQDGSGQLKIQLDYTMATRAKGVVDGADNLANIEDAQVDIQFGTHLEWKRNLDIKDGQLYKMAVDGYQDMTTNFGLYEFKQGQGNQKPPALPNVMTAFAFGKEIILVSSHKGKPFIDRTGPPSTILRSLQACQRTYAQDGQGPNKNHRHNARCGEIFALYHAELLHKAEDIKAMTPLKMVTIERDWKATDEQYAVKNPCSPDDNPSGPGGKMNFGCQFFLATKYDEIHVVPDDVEEEDYVLSELAGEPHENPTISSLDACKGVRKRHALDGIFKRFSELLSW